MKRSEVDRKIDGIIEFSGIGRYIDTPVKRYSSGMYVRLAFAVAAHLDSDILIADEVLAVGDAEFQKKALGKMDQLSRGEGRTVLFVSHNMDAVKSLCNKGIVLDKGKLVYNSDISSAANFYLGEDKYRQHSDVLRYEFGDGFFFPCGILSIESFSILENGEEAPYRIDCDENARYTLRIKGIMKKPTENIMIFYSIFKGSENIYTTDMYSGEGIKPGDIPEGPFTLEFDLPFKFLMTGEYRISLTADLHGYDSILRYEQNRLDFVLIRDYPPHPVFGYEHPMNYLNEEGIGNSWRPGVLMFNSRAVLLK